MKILLSSTLVTGLLLSSTLFAKAVPDSDEGWHSHQPMLLLKEKAEEKVESKKEALKILDKVLSPFEDMIEYALDKDVNSMINGYKNILAIEKSVKSSTLSYKTISSDIKHVGHYIDTKNYSQVALLSTNIFKNIVNHFAYHQYVENQLHVENLDGMGFELLALLGSKKIDYKQLSSIIENSKQHWIAIRDKVNDKNSQEAFDLLFKAFSQATIKKDNQMIKILASMDLALVDIVEKQLK